MSWTNIDLLHHRTAVLSNGSAVTLAEAVKWFDRLQSAKDADDLEWEPLYHLRQLALGKTIAPEAVQTFIRAGLLGSDGTLDNRFREIILSSIRGEDRDLHLESPFTEKLDRSLAEFVHAREVILAATDLGQLDPDMVKSFLSPSRFDKALEEFSKLHEESSQTGERPLGTNLPVPTPDPKTFAERVMRKAQSVGEPNKSPSPPPPPPP